MKKVIYLICVLTLCVLFYGCPLSSDYPIDAPSVKTDNLLCGRWKSVNFSNNTDVSIFDSVYTISKKDNYTYSVKGLKNENGVIKEDQYDGYISVVNYVNFINIRKDSKYYLFSIENTKPYIFIKEIADTTVTFKNSSEVKNYIATRMNKNDFYVNIALYERY